jgi:hypothetical protein
MGLNLQYGVARIMNLANGEMLVRAASRRSGSGPAAGQPASDALLVAPRPSRSTG